MKHEHHLQTRAGAQHVKRRHNCCSKSRRARGGARVAPITSAPARARASPRGGIIYSNCRARVRVEITRLEKDHTTLKPHRDLLYLFARCVLDSEPNATTTGARDKPERSTPPPMPANTDTTCSGGMTRGHRSRASHL